MIRTAILCLAVAGLTACATPIRTGPPAPIVSAPTSPPTQATPVRPVEPEPEVASVYAYKAPSTIDEGPAAEAPTAPGALPRPETAAEPTRSGTADAPSEVASAVPPSVPDVAEAPQMPAAAQSLTQRAEQQRQARDYAGAAASLERALRIEPQSAYLWNRLARVRLEQGLISQAGNLAARSNSLAGDEPSLKQDNWAMIAVARRSAGDAAGAAEADRLARGG
ncbi:tetratricopeptide repeat protein [Thiococcus pfennigii]|uniref:tetratricopeptide repeat protein n=2 Tax=Thiococcus pfennigii TaxID=1057 RepID=UPI0019036A48|nr:tetratricopeptide repeat protein [Thiococcus pfennigii]MBK1732182.1 hypothetical protein [Thiococcus pfennigii]